MSNSFWEFSVATYAKDGVPSACLALQDSLDVDVNVLLFCCWFGLTRGPIEEERFARLLLASETWASRVVRPLRAVRRWMKQDVYESLQPETQSVSGLREKIKSNELSAEKIQQDLLLASVEDLGGKQMNVEEQLDAVVENILLYLDKKGIEAGGASAAELCHVISSASDNFESATVKARLEQHC